MAREPDSPLVSEGIAHELFRVFSRLEHALKVAGMGRTRNGVTEADWDSFAKSIQAAFDGLNDPGITEAVTFLVGAPPRQQVEVKGSLTWKEVKRPPGLSDMEYVLRVVRRVRNNLFHGGKYSPAGPVEPGRDQQLVERSLIVLKACVPLSNGVRAAYAAIAL